MKIESNGNWVPGFCEPCTFGEKHLVDIVKIRISACFFIVISARLFRWSGG